MKSNYIDPKTTSLKVPLIVKISSKLKKIIHPRLRTLKSKPKSLIKS
jgi:hypothetical protein